VPLTATENDGYEFVNWTDAADNVVSTQPGFTFTMPAEDVTLTANFQEETVDPDTYTLTLLVDPANAGTVTGEGDYEEGDEVPLTATENEGYEFVNWTDDADNVVSTQPGFTFTMPAEDVTLTANFQEEDLEPDTYTLTLLVDPANAGTVSGEGDYEEGDDVPVTATENEGYEFVNWTDDADNVVSTQPGFTFTMPAEDVTLTANFQEETVEPDTYTLTLLVDPANAGNVTGEGDYEEGMEVPVTATENEGYEFVNWTDVADNVVSNLPNFTFTMPAEDLTLTANFQEEDLEPDTYTLTLLVDPANAGTVIGEGDYEEGMEVPVTATENEGYEFVNWTDVADNVVSNLPNFTFTMPAEDVTLTANFQEETVEPDTYTLTLLVDPANAGTVTGEGEYEEGDEVPVTATENEGYEFVNWTDEAENVVSTQPGFTFTMPAEDVTLTANFQEEDEPDTFTLTLGSLPAEGGSVEGDGNYPPGESVAISATPHDGFQFIRWQGDNQHVENLNHATTTVTMPEENISLIAVFDQETGLAEMDADKIMVYPNPASTKLYVEFESSGKTGVTLYDLQGRSMEKVSVEKSGKVQIRFNVEYLQAGVYLLGIKEETHYHIQKVLIQP